MRFPDVPRIARWGPLFTVLYLLGFVGYVGCFARHFCQCGHREHPPYTFWDDAIDVCWVALFFCASSVAIMRWGPINGSLWATLLIALIVSRFEFAGTMGLSLICCEIPASIALLMWSCWAAFGNDDSPVTNTNP
ncbi:hypothetical protein [Limnoglobus roseus]|uniref:Uncharacterized protein n=1 Tax=Limnoglobus roseus TaxID=2598579 RepID=A0A5C1AFP4_9BACT|nr:hypothetical protein [Limnoglobus roseus]QEL15808.1 hypothetical protein PX52LOC_02744 [Limnoglobus roseus]